jgi:prepilin-type N-terminal cleavage/methylation domain-containing protein
VERQIHSPAAEQGFTFIEVMVAAMILLVGMLGVVTLADVGNKKTSENLAREGATNLAKEVVERSREIAYNSLTKDASGRPSALTSLPGLTTTGGAGTWTVTGRRNVTYAITADVCELDSPADGVSVRSSNFCDLTTGPGAPGTPITGATVSGGVYSDLVSLGLNLNVNLSGVASTVMCNILGANPGLNTTLGGLSALVGGGAGVHVCDASGSSSSQVAIDPNPDDIKRVIVTVSWTKPASGSVVQSTLIPNPDGGSPVT